ncbi:MAG: hypothetical protein HQL31_01515 [Planctomycetes bacterium]|nr:hypothetical protein [Planctomycetota bacterium]
MARPSLVLIDIEEQDEVILFTRQALEQAGLGDEVDLLPFQARAGGLEEDYDLSPLHWPTPCNMLMMHTKALRVAGGGFRDECWMGRFFADSGTLAQSPVVFYSGDIQEFKDHVELIRAGSQRRFLPEGQVEFVGVFELLYPGDGSGYGEWLAKKLVPFT